MDKTSIDEKVTQPDNLHKIEHTLELHVPVRVAYNQWTQFEMFPHFMDGVEHVEQYDDTHLHWVAVIAGQKKSWDAEIVEQEPDQKVAWRSISGATNNGSVTFEPKGPDKCRITLVLSYAPEDAKEKIGDALGILRLKVAGDLRRFKHFIETLGVETGAWRGEVHGGHKTARTHGRGRDRKIDPSSKVDQTAKNDESSRLDNAPPGF